MAQVTLPYTLTAGTPENVNNLVSNLNALVTGVNTIDTAQIATGAVTSAKLASGATSATFVTSLPGSPVDGQEVFYQSTTAGTGGASNSMADVGAVWHLRYRSASTSAYKWEFVGGGPTTGVGSGETGFTSSAFRTNGQASLTLPAVAGDYFITLQAYLVSDSAIANNVLCVLFDDATQTSLELIHVASGQYDAGVQARTARLDAVSASSVLTTKHQTLNSVASNIAGIQIAVTPIRVG